MKILHIITSLGGGGASRMLGKLIDRSRQIQTIEHHVAVLSDVVGIENEIASVGGEIHRFDIPARSPSVRGFIKLRHVIQDLGPDLIHGWMYHGNIVARAAAPKGVPLIWGIRHSLHDISREKLLTRALIRVGPRLANGVNDVVYCSYISSKQHEAMGYPADKTRIIPNGFDLEEYCPNSESRISVRTDLGLPDDAVLLGNAARYHPMKNHMGLLQAFRDVQKSFPNTYLLMAGAGVDYYNQSLTSLIQDLGLRERVLLLGPRKDMSRFMPALDIYVSPSLWGEAFPNVLGEAMASGVPCVTTDVGDSGLIVGNTGHVVPPENDNFLVEAIADLIEIAPDKRRNLGLAARRKVEKEYSLPTVVNQYVRLYSEHT